MKKLFSKSFAAIIISACIFQVPVLAQVKTNFTPEIRTSGSKPTGLVSGEHILEYNNVDVKMPKKTRGVIERYKKLNIWGNEIPDSFLFFRNVLNKNQKAVYDVAYKALMKNEKEVTLPVGITKEEFYDTMHALNYDNPEAFWWDDDYSYWTNSDETVTNFVFKYWLNGSELEQKYQEFWNATTPIIYYASNLPDDMSKIKYIHDYICLSCEYNNDAVSSGNTGGKQQSAYSGSVEYKTICGGYAALFQYYMQQLGIPCAKIRSTKHAWNFLQVNGQYYQMDITWNDADLIPTYYNLTHEEMQKINSHTPWDLDKKIIDSHPSTNNQMSYLQYFGALLVGSPYTYQELNNYDYEENCDKTDEIKIYTNEPKILPIVKNADELKDAIKKTYGSDYYDGTVFTFFVPTLDDLNGIYDRLGSGDICQWKDVNSSYTGKSLVCSLTLASSKMQSEETNVTDTQINTEIPRYLGTTTNNVEIISSIYVTLGGGDSKDAKKAAKSFSNVAAVNVKNLEDGLFELVLSVTDETEIRPALAKKFIEEGFNLFELRNTEATSAPKIGDIGPGGGIVFYIDGKKAYECSLVLGQKDWEDAKTTCKNFRGSGKSDWNLPTKEQLDYIYQNLKKAGIISDDTWYWASSYNDDGNAWVQNFKDGEHYYTPDKSYTLSVRAVRSFNY